MADTDNLPEGLTRQDVDPARRGTEPETGYRQEALMKAASEEQNRLAEENARRLKEIGDRKAGRTEAGEDKEHGSIAATVVPEAVQAGEDEAGSVSGEDAARAIGNVTKTHIEREPGAGEGDGPREGGKPGTARRNKKNDDD